MTRKSAKFFKARRTHLLRSDIDVPYTQLLSDVNKYIFVQEFERAENLLADLSKKYENNCEIHFRRIEVACRLGNVENLVKEYKVRSKKNPKQVSLSLAALLTEIRLLEKDNGPFVETSEVINPSLQISKLFDFPRSEASILSSQTGSRFASLRGEQLHLNRLPDVADDFSPLELPLIPEFEIQGQESPKKIAPQNFGKSPLLDSALHFVNQNPQNYATHFILGCAFEFTADLNQAIESWSKAFELNPASITVLSTLAELQQIGALPADKDYISRFESIDKNLVHGSYDTHVGLYHEFLTKKEYKLAIAALRTLSDWLYRQRGAVPEEIEVLCLAGAMKAYNLEGNTAASEACLHEVENLVVAIKKSPKNPQQLYFVAQICDEFSLKSLSKILYLAILTQTETPIETLIRVAAHMVTQYPSAALKECLKVAYRNTSGHAEIRFCQLLCNLALAHVPFEKYLTRRAQIRDLISKKDIGRVFGLLNEALQDTNEDPEVHYYLGEMLERLGSHAAARQHFELMYDLDSLNIDTVHRYMHFLLKNKDFELLIEIAKRTLEFKDASTQQIADSYFIRATAYYALQNSEEAKIDCEKALSFEPWKIQYLTLAIQILQLEIPSTLILPHNEIQNELNSHVYGEQGELSETFVLGLYERARSALDQGLYEYAFNAAKCAYILKSESEFVVDLLVKACAAFHSRASVQHILMLLNTNRTNMAQSSILAARIYAQSGEWALVEEWLDIAERSGTDDRILKNKFFELKALSLVLGGKEIKKAQNLIETVIDSLEGRAAAPAIQILYGYILTLQGELRQGLEKIRQNIELDPNIQSLYFYIKALERAGLSENQAQGPLSYLFGISPTNSFELKMVEEIYFISGLKNSGPIKALAC